MPGIISGFVKGAGEAAAEAGKMQLQAQIQREMSEANALRDAELRGGLQKERMAFEAGQAEAERAFTTSEREAKQAYEAEEAAKERTSKETIETIKGGGAGGDATTKMKNARDLMKQGYPKDVANAVAQGALKQVEDKDTGDMVLINALNNKPVGRLASVGKRGTKEWIPEGEAAQVVEPTTEDIAQAEREYRERASIFESDKSQFGMSESKWKTMRAKEIARERMGGQGGGGIVGRQMQQAPAATPATTGPMSDDEYERMKRELGL